MAILAPLVCPDSSSNFSNPNSCNADLPPLCSTTSNFALPIFSFSARPLGKLGKSGPANPLKNASL